MTSSPDREKLLCVDVGNTRIKAAVGDGRRWERLPSAATGATGRLWAGRRLDGVVAAVVSSVVPTARRRVGAAVRRLTGVEPWFVDHRWRFPFRIDVSPPSSVGVDRLCAAVGATRGGARTFMVVDVGSAITVDLVSRSAYRGGLILAGPDLELRALASFAEQLPAIDFPRSGNPLGRRRRGTRSSMILGAGYGAVGAIKAAVAYLRPRYGARPRIFVTGGGAQALRRGLPRSWAYRPDLVLEGLYIAGRARRRSRRR